MDEEIKELKEQIDQIDNDVYELKEYVLPEDKKPSSRVRVSKFEVIVQLILFGIIFLLGIIIGMVV